MTQPALSLALAFACSTLDATAQTLVDWDFSGLVNPQVNNGPTVNPLIPAGSATLAPGLTTTRNSMLDGGASCRMQKHRPRA